MYTWKKKERCEFGSARGVAHASHLCREAPTGLTGDNPLRERHDSPISRQMRTPLPATPGAWCSNERETVVVDKKRRLRLG